MGGGHGVRSGLIREMGERLPARRMRAGSEGEAGGTFGAARLALHTSNAYGHFSSLIPIPGKGFLNVGG